MRQVVAVVVLILTLAGAFASGLRTEGACPMQMQDHAAHMAAWGEAHGLHGNTPAPSGLADFCKHACLSTLLPQPVAATPVVSRAAFLPAPADPVLPASLRPDLTDRPPKTLA